MDEENIACGIEMNESLSEFKDQISKEEVSEEIDDISNYMKNNKNISSSFDEAFPNFVRESGLTGWW